MHPATDPDRYAVLFPAQGPPTTVGYGAQTIGKGARLIVAVNVLPVDPWVSTSLRTRLLPEGRVIFLHPDPGPPTPTP